MPSSASAAVQALGKHTVGQAAAAKGDPASRRLSRSRRSGRRSACRGTGWPRRAGPSHLPAPTAGGGNPGRSDRRRNPPAWREASVTSASSSIAAWPSYACRWHRPSSAAGCVEQPAQAAGRRAIVEAGEKRRHRPGEGVSAKPLCDLARCAPTRCSAAAAIRAGSRAARSPPGSGSGNSPPRRRHDAALDQQHLAAPVLTPSGPIPCPSSARPSTGPVNPCSPATAATCAA